MKNLKKFVLTGIVGAISATSFGQFTLSGEYRPRAEYRHGYKSVADTNQKNAFFIDQRTRLNLDYVVSDYQFYLSVQDIRTWGANSQLNVSDGFMSVHEAWAKVNLNTNWGIKLGRQEIKYDDHRIFGNVGWAQQARSHDAALIQFKNDKSKLDIGFAFNQDKPQMKTTDYTVGSSYRDMQYAWFNTKLSEKITMSLLAMNIGQQVDVLDVNANTHKSMQYITTLGTHTKFDFGKFNANFNGYYQLGSAPVTPVKPTSAYLIGLDMSYKVAEPFTIGLGYETQSGTNQADTTKAYNDRAHNFNPVFGTNHKFNGLMDYFYVGSGHMGRGLQDAYVKFNYKKGNWTAGLDVHLFMTGLGVNVLDAVSYNNAYNDAVTAGASQAELDAIDPLSYKLNSMLGTELDFSLGTKINKSVALKFGYSHMLATETLATLKGVTYTSGPDAGRGRTDQVNNWGYVMVIIKPTFLKK